MPKKLITLDDLALMVNNGFEDMRKRVERVEHRVGSVETKVERIEKKVNNLPTRSELLNYATLQKQVFAVREYLRDTFNARV